MKKLFLILVSGLLIAVNAAAQTFEARVNRDNIPEGETFLLTVELSGAKSNNAPDFSVLNKDFTVYSVANSYRTNIINGNVSQSQQWNLVMMPNEKGKLTIPAISLDKYQTKPLTISVGIAPAKQPQAQQPETAQPRFKIEAEVDNRKPYVQQQINYTLTLYDSGGLQGDAPIFMTSADNNWIIKNLGAPEISTQNIGGQNVREIKFRYALFAQKSGKQEIPAVRFNGYYLTKESRTDPFAGLFDDDMFIGGFGMADVFATRTPVILTAKPIAVDVRPAAPENGNHWWLPAESVRLYAEFNPQQPRFRVGEAVSRNIYLQAVGVIDSQLPEINFTNVEGVKQYPEKPQIEMRVEDGKIVALEKIANVYIPNKAGSITLPEISLNWYNIKTNSVEKAVLPPITVKVWDELPVEDETDTTAAPANKTTEPEPAAKAPAQQQQTNIYLLAGGAFVLGALLCLLIILLGGKWQRRSKNFGKAVISSAEAKDIRGVRDNLLLWANQKFAEAKILSLKDIDETINDKEFRCELDKLTEALYSDDNKDWNEHLFIRVFKKISKLKKGSSKHNEPLPKLYK